MIYEIKSERHPLKNKVFIAILYDIFNIYCDNNEKIFFQNNEFIMELYEKDLYINSKYVYDGIDIDIHLFTNIQFENFHAIGHPQIFEFNTYTIQQEIIWIY